MEGFNNNDKKEMRDACPHYTVPMPRWQELFDASSLVYNSSMTTTDNSKPPARLSVGVFIRNAQGQWLLGHATGQKHWDIFKGMPDEGEAPHETALRELREETGIVLPSTVLTDTGVHAYRADKKLHIFAAFMDVEPSVLQCTSFFKHPKSEQTIPEMDAFAWFTPEEAKEKAVPRLWAILDSLVAPLPMVMPSGPSI